MSTPFRYQSPEEHDRFGCLGACGDPSCCRQGEDYRRWLAFETASEAATQQAIARHAEVAAHAIRKGEMCRWCRRQCDGGCATSGRESYPRRDY